MAEASLPHYGADQSGLIYGYVFSPDGVGRQIDTVETLAWLNRENTESEFVWLHFNGVHTATMRWLSAHLKIDQEFYDVLREGAKSTRIEDIHGNLIAVVNDVVYDLLQEAAIKIATVYLCVMPRCVVSVRIQPLRSVDRLRKAVKGGEIFPSPLSLLVHLLRDQADVLVQIMRAATEKVDDIEDGLLADRVPERNSIGNIRRDLVRLQRLLAPEPAALFRLLHRPPNWVAVSDAQDLRQSTEEFSVVLRDMAGLQERIKSLQEEILSQTSERMNRSVFVLTAVTVLALPINLTAGLFGMNVGGIPYNDNPAGFWIVLVIVTVVTLAAAWFAFRHGAEH